MALSTIGTAARLTLGPLLFHWPPQRWRDFYFRIADEAPVDSVCLGEVVCAKRQPFTAPHFDAVAERLAGAGKEVIISTLALIMNDREMAAVRETIAAATLTVEANDMAAVALLAGRPHAIGPFVTVHNEGTLAFLVERGATRVCPPVELAADSLAVLAAAGGAEIEVQVFGRLPLAVSARCYHARSHGRRKDNCNFACGDDGDGLAVETLDGDPFLAINGTHVMSHAYCNLMGEMAALRNMGIHRFRLSPHGADMVAVATLYRDVLDDRCAPRAATARLGELVAGAAFADGYFHGAPGAALVAR